MSNTYTQLFIHLIFAVKYREGVIAKSWRQELYQYIVGIAEKRGHKIYAIGGMPDHIHILVSISPSESISSLVAEIKRSTSLWINSNKFVRGKFYWQEGFGAFSYGKSQISAVAKYIQNQEEHHGKTSFKEEYLSFLRLFGIPHDEKYIFHPLE